MYYKNRKMYINGSQDIFYSQLLVLLPKRNLRCHLQYKVQTRNMCAVDQCKWVGDEHTLVAIYIQQMDAPRIRNIDAPIHIAFLLKIVSQFFNLRIFSK